MPAPDISTATLIAIGVVALFCLLGPVVAQAAWARRRPWLWASFGFGVLTFTVSQLLTRIPLITAVLPVLPEWQALLANAVLAAFVLGFSAGLFEETGRLLVMGQFFNRRRTHADGVAFGLGHGGIEAAILVGLSLVNVLVIGVMVRSGQWPTLAASTPPEALAALRDQLSGVSPLMAAYAGLERLSAIILHIALSLLILLGLSRRKPLVAWLLAVVIHGVVNALAVIGLSVWAWPVWVVQLVLFGIAAVLLVWIVRSRGWFPEPDRPRNAPRPSA